MLRRQIKVHWAALADPSMTQPLARQAETGLPCNSHLAEPNPVLASLATLPPSQVLSSGSPPEPASDKAFDAVHVNSECGEVGGRDKVGKNGVRAISIRTQSTRG